MRYAKGYICPLGQICQVCEVSKDLTMQLTDAVITTLLDER